MLSNYEDEAGKTGIMAIERCRPDYESQVKNLNEKLSKSKALLAALFDYIGIGQVREKLAEMIGELVCEERRLNKKIEAVLEAWENDPDPKK